MDRAPLVLDAVDWDRPFLPRNELAGRLARHYRGCLLRGLYRLVGSFECLGNPTGLVSRPPPPGPPTRPCHHRHHQAKPLGAFAQSSLLCGVSDRD